MNRGPRGWGPADGARVARFSVRRFGTPPTPRHHFGTKRGLLTAIATRGFEELAARLVALREAGAPLVEIGVAYVRFALENPAAFHVMFEPTVLDLTDPALVRARAAAYAELDVPASQLAASGGGALVTVAAWSLMHGLATLLLSGNLAAAPVPSDVDPLDLARDVARLLNPAPSDPPSTEGELP